MGAGVLGAKVEDQGFLILAVEEVGGWQRLVAAGVFGGVGGHFRCTEGMLLAQRVSLPIRRHEDAPQVGVPAETDTVHVEDFPLIPVGGGENGADAGQLRVLSVQVCLDADMARRVEAEQVVVEGEIGVARGFAAA